MSFAEKSGYFAKRVLKSLKPRSAQVGLAAAVGLAFGVAADSGVAFSISPFPDPEVAGPIAAQPAELKPAPYSVTLKSAYLVPEARTWDNCPRESCASIPERWDPAMSALAETALANSPAHLRNSPITLVLDDATGLDLARKEIHVNFRDLTSERANLSEADIVSALFRLQNPTYLRNDGSQGSYWFDAVYDAVGGSAGEAPQSLRDVAKDLTQGIISRKAESTTNFALMPDFSTGFRGTPEQNIIKAAQDREYPVILLDSALRRQHARSFASLGELIPNGDELGRAIDQIYRTGKAR